MFLSCYLVISSTKIYVMLFSCSAVTCPAMWYALDMNSNDTSIGAVVQASCPPGQVFRDSSLSNNVTATCLECGKWNPVLTDCKGIILNPLNLLFLPTSSIILDILKELRQQKPKSSCRYLTALIESGRCERGLDSKCWKCWVKNFHRI